MAASHGGSPRLVAVDYDPFASSPLARVVPTTEPQREIWLAAHLGREGTLAYNESASLRLRGATNVEALRGAIQDLVSRNDALRSTLSGDGLSLCVGAFTRFDVPLVDLSRMAPSEREGKLQEIAVGEVETPFDLEQGPLFRAQIVRIGQDEHVLILTVHHIICDGWSYWVIVKEISQLYAARLGLRSEPLAPPESFADYALATQRLVHSPVLAENERYWLGRFESLPPAIDLPRDRPRPASRTQTAGREDHLLDAELVADIKRVGARQGASLFVSLLAAFSALLGRLTGQQDIVVGIPAAGQSIGGHERLIGHCVNLLPLRSSVDPETPFTSLLKVLRKTMLDAYEHQQYTFGTLLQKLPLARDPSRLPLVGVVFNIDQALDAEKNSFPNLELEYITNPRRYENFELFVNAAQIGGTLRLECQYNSDLLDAATIGRWLRCFEVMLRDAVRNPEAPLGRLAVLPEEERKTLARFNATELEFDRTARIHELVTAQAARTPDTVALVSAGETLTYGELATRARRVALVLLERGVRPNTLVGLYLDRGKDMVVGLLGILMAGAGYLPLDRALPTERLAFMLDDADAHTIVTQTASKHVWEGSARSLVCVDGDEVAAKDANSFAAPAGSSEDVAYVIYTSGSTGKPKGVLVPHRAVVNLLSSVRREPGMRPQDVVLAVTTLSFDISVSEVILPLAIGATIVVAGSADVTDGDRLRALVEQHEVTFIDATPATWRLLLAANWRDTARVTAICTGEPLPRDLAADLLPRVGSLWNGYGPTETTVWSSFCRVTTAEGAIPIGRPIANTQIHVLDARRQPVPIGVVGELFVGGAGVTHGYLNRPELTQERFVPDPFAGFEDARMYQTGDLGRWRSDGILECLGRTDFQVKVRGYRIELGEVEAALVSHPSVSQAVVVAREDRPGDVRLVAYAVGPTDALDEPDLRDHLRRTLPDYMVPQHFVLLPEMPTLPNGKVDRKRLPAPALQDRVETRGHARPQSELEKRVLAVFEQRLGLPGLGVEDDFFARGGHSLLAAQLVAQLNRDLGLSLPMRVVFEAPTAATLARRIEEQRGSKTQGALSPIERRSDQSRAPLSLMQQRLWFLEQMHPGNVMFNTPAAHRLRGVLEEPAFERAMNEMVRRQPSLRTVIRLEQGEPVQIVIPEVRVQLLPAEDLSSLEPEARQHRLLARVRELTLELFDFATGPLFRSRLFRLGPDEHAIVFVVHHIVWDGWSFDLFYEEMNALYEAYRHGQPSPLPDLPVTYGDFAAWHKDWLQGETLRAQVAHWKAHLTGHTEPLELPADRPRPPEMSGTGITEWIDLPQDRTAAVRAVGREANATLFMTLLAAFYVYLWHLSKQADLVVGTPVRGRAHVEVEKLMGFFVNAIAIRKRIDPEQPFLDFVRDVRATVLEGFGRPDVPFEHLVRELKLPRDESRFPIYQAFFSFQDARHRPTAWGNLRHERIPVLAAGLPEDIGLWFVERPWGLIGALSLNADIFSEATTRRFRDRYLALLHAILADPKQPIANLSLIGAPERAEIADASERVADYDQSAILPALFEKQADQTPQRIALCFGSHELTYAELDARANRMARLLRARGVKRGTLVGLCLERSPDLLISVLAVLKAGGTYLPLDPAFPASRLAFMVEDSGLGLVVSESALAERHGCGSERTLELDQARPGLDAESSERLPADGQCARAEDVAYVLYTSGSTGKPKGVRIPHRAAVNFLIGMQQEPGLGADDRLVAVTTLSFDIALLELMLPLSVGAQIVLASQEETMDGKALRTLLESSRATVMQATPVTWRFLIESGWRGHGEFRALCGGEALPVDLAEALLERTGELWNMYGPTETTVWSTCWRVERPRDGIFVGHPVANTTIRILDAHLKECPIGVPGEITIGGDGLAVDYLNRPELTAERFIPDPYSPHPGARLYRTGDLGRWREQGLLECLGRTDFQVKVRGHRIELGEIESAVVAHPGVKQAVVVVREDRPGDARLVAYVMVESGRFEESSLRNELRRQLPDYMVPQHFVTLSAFPTTPNGKVDRKALPAPIEAAPVQAPIRAPSGPLTPTEAQLIEVWKKLLGVPHILRNDNFFDLGGHSLSAMQAIGEMEKLVGRRLSPREYIFQSLGQIAESYDAGQAPPPPPPENKGLLKRVFSALRRN